MSINIISQIIAFEGIDGAGKDTQLQQIKKYLTEQSTTKNPIIVIDTCEPNDTPEGKRIRQLLSGNPNTNHPNRHSIQTLDKNYLFSLYLIDRKKNAYTISKQVGKIYQDYLTQFSHQSSSNNLESVKVYVLSSRCDLSSYAYQVEGDTSSTATLNCLDKIYDSHHYITLSNSLNRSLNRSLSRSLAMSSINNKNVKDANPIASNPDKLNALIPDLTLYYDLNPEEAIKRINLRGKAEGFEKKASLTTIRANYHQAIRYLTKKDGRKIVILDAHKPLSEMTQETREIFSSFVSSTNQAMSI